MGSERSDQNDDLYLGWHGLFIGVHGLMTATVTYTTVAGMLMMENRGGVETEYISDPLGNLIQCRDMNGNKTYEAWYWSYGEIREETGTNPSPWGFVGLLGYYTDALNFLYVRARYYRPNLTRWQTVDPIWPVQSPYRYAGARPVDIEDSLGLQVQIGIIIASAIAGCAISVVAGLLGNYFSPYHDPNIGCKSWFNCAAGALQGLGGSITVSTAGAGAGLGCLFGALAAALTAIGGHFCDCRKNPCCRWSGPDTICDALANTAAGCTGGALFGGAGTPGAIAPEEPPVFAPPANTVGGGVAGTLLGTIANAVSNLCKEALS